MTMTASVEELAADAHDGETRKVRKGERTRERILEAALALFARQGFAGATMRDIAAEAGCSLGLAYRYFSRKEDMVLALYDRLAQELSDEADRLPKSKLAERWAAIEIADLERLAPHRDALAALFGAGLSPDAPTQVLGGATAEIRDRVRGVFARVVNGASDAPKREQSAEITTLFYAAHLSLVLFYLQDRTHNQKATRDLIAFGREILALLRPALGLPMVSRYLSRLADIFMPLFGPPETGTFGEIPTKP
ncbi:MAG: TetR/AcrR family transcriptional regulator [Akkermansiaceae bacterium]|nr:TetR/AcrR family transcriptional regulator [Armatimonadota bacterium]